MYVYTNSPQYHCILGGSYVCPIQSRTTGRGGTQLVLLSLYYSLYFNCAPSLQLLALHLTFL